MIRYEDMCVGPCPQGCMGSGCPYKSVPVYSCDECDEEHEPDDLYVYNDGRHLCKSCLLENYQKLSEVI